MTEKNRGLANGDNRRRSNGRAASGPRLHRLAAVRQAKRLTHRELARRMNIGVDEVKLQEQETRDLSLSTICKWSIALGVPMTELLLDSDPELPSPGLDHAHVKRLLEAAKRIRAEARRPAIQRMAQTLIEQLIEIAPELKELAARARPCRRVSHSGYRLLPEGVFVDWSTDR